MNAFQIARVDGGQFKTQWLIANPDQCNRERYSGRCRQLYSNMAMNQGFVEILDRILKENKISNAEINRRTGIDATQLSRFRRSQVDMTVSAFQKVVSAALNSLTFANKMEFLHFTVRGQPY